MCGLAILILENDEKQQSHLKETGEGGRHRSSLQSDNFLEGFNVRDWEAGHSDSWRLACISQGQNRSFLPHKVINVLNNAMYIPLARSHLLCMNVICYEEEIHRQQYLSYFLHCVPISEVAGFERMYTAEISVSLKETFLWYLQSRRQYDWLENDSKLLPSWELNVGSILPLYTFSMEIFMKLASTTRTSSYQLLGAFAHIRWASMPHSWQYCFSFQWSLYAHQLLRFLEKQAVLLQLGDSYQCDSVALRHLGIEFHPQYR